MYWWEQEDFACYSRSLACNGHTIIIILAYKALVTSAPVFVKMGCSDSFTYNIFFISPSRQFDLICAALDLLPAALGSVGYFIYLFLCQPQYTI